MEFDNFSKFCLFRSRFRTILLLKNCIYLSSKHTRQHLFSLLTLFNVPIGEVCQKFVIFGVNLRLFSVKKQPLCFRKRLLDNIPCTMLIVFNILVHEFFRKFDKNCLKMFKIWKFLVFFVIFGSFSFQKTDLYLQNDYWTTSFCLCESFQHSNPRHLSETRQKLH